MGFPGGLLLPQRACLDTWQSSGVPAEGVVVGFVLGCKRLPLRGMDGKAKSAVRHRLLRTTSPGVFSFHLSDGAAGRMFWSSFIPLFMHPDIQPFINVTNVFSPALSLHPHSGPRTLSLVHSTLALLADGRPVSSSLVLMLGRPL